MKREKERVSGRENVRERNNTKIMYRIVTVTMHICIITIVLVHLCTILQPLMWVFFGSKFVK